MNPKQQLYVRLEKDAEATAKREKRYAKMALYERRFAEKDKAIAERKHQIARIEDDRQEADICDIFKSYRLGVAHHYSDVARKMRKLSKGV